MKWGPGIMYLQCDAPQPIKIARGGRGLLFLVDWEFRISAPTLNIKLRGQEVTQFYQYSLESNRLFLVPFWNYSAEFCIIFSIEDPGKSKNYTLLLKAYTILHLPLQIM